MTEKPFAAMLDLSTLNDEKHKAEPGDLNRTTCPKCGSETDNGFGLAFGGYGPYVHCTSDTCDWAKKELLSDDEC